MIWLSYPTLFIRLQGVRQLAQLFEYPTSYHSIASSLSTSSLYVNMLNCLNTSRLIILSHPLHPSPGRTWACSIVWIPHLIILYHLLHPSPERTWTWTIVWILVHLIIFLSSPAHRTWTSSIIFYKNPWSDLSQLHPLQDVRELHQLFEYPPHLIIPFHTCLQKVRELSSIVFRTSYLSLMALQPFSKPFITLHTQVEWYPLDKLCKCTNMPQW